jgi:hypothetical protein
LKPIGRTPKIALLSLALWYPFGLLVCLVHEAGHATICEIDGYKWTFYYDFSRGCMIDCPPSDENDWRNNMMGGVYGTILVGAIFGVFLKAHKHYLLILLPALSLMYIPDQVVKIFLEGFFFSTYKSTFGITLVTAIQGASMGAGMFFILLQDKKKQMT